MRQFELKLKKTNLAENKKMKEEKCHQITITSDIMLSYIEEIASINDISIEMIEMMEEEIQNQEDQADNVDKFIRQAKKYLHLEKLTPTILNDMVNAVYVHSPDKASGHRVQDVEISYNDIVILPAALLYDLQNGKTA